jgi:ribonuclease D
MQNKESIKNALSAADHPILLETPAQLARAAKAWRRKAVLGLDTEFVRERTYRADLGLVQVSDGQTAWLIDPVANTDLAPLKRLLSDSGVLKVFHSASEDLEVLMHSVGELPVPMVDTQIACAMLGEPLQMAYHNAAKRLLDVDIDKDQTRSNWCRRPLHANQLRYAAMDVVLLPAMLGMLKSRLEQAGRWDWLVEDVARMQKRSLQTVEPALAYRRVSGIGRLDQASLRILQALAAWREERASHRNLARNFVIRDKALFDIASAAPRTAEDLQAIDGIHPKVMERNREQWLSLIGEALDSDQAVETVSPLSNAQRKRLDRMRRLVRERADELQLDPALLASRKELEKLIRAVDEQGELPERFGGWRQGVITDALLAER